MVKTRTELDTLLKSLSIQVFYNHTTTKDVVNTPYIVYFDTGSNNMFADNQTYGEIMSYTIILFSDKRDETSEASIKNLLTTNNIPYEIGDIDWNDDILLWSVQFEITL